MNTSQPLESQYIRVVLNRNPINVHYHDVSKGPSNRPPIVLTHGSGPGASAARNYSANIEHFVRSGFRVIAIDWPGWGQSDTLICTGSRSNVNATLLRLVLDAIGLTSPFYLIGNSMGAHSATMFAVENPGRVSKLILIGGGNGGRSLFQPAITEGVQKIKAFYEHPSPQTMLEFLRVATFKGPLICQETAQLRFETAMMRPDHIESYCESSRANSLPYPDISARLPEINAPTLVIWGRDDRIVPLDLGLRVAALVPKADMIIFNQCGHVPHSEHANKFNHLATSFLIEP